VRLTNPASAGATCPPLRILRSAASQRSAARGGAARRRRRHLQAVVRPRPREPKEV